MMWVLAILLLLTALVLYLMLAPIVLEVDTVTDTYQVRYHKLLRVHVLWQEKGPTLSIHVFRWQKQIELLKSKPKVDIQKAEVDDRTKPKKKGSGFKLGKRTMLQLIGSCRVSRWYVSFDTGDMVLNGQLYPLVYLAGQQLGKPTTINFWGENVVQVSISNNLGRLGRIFIQHKLNENSHERSK